MDTNLPQAESAASHRAVRSMIEQSGLFLESWYLEANPDVAQAGIDPLDHFLCQGAAELRWPNPYFDPSWYLKEYTDVSAAGQNALLHFYLYGEREGRRPISFFDPTSYRALYGNGEAFESLAHYLKNRYGGEVSPVPEFDAAWYLKSYDDVKKAGVDPFEHYLHYGFREGRDPSPNFDTRWYRKQYLSASPNHNPLLHYLQNRHLIDLHTKRPRHEKDIPGIVRENIQPGPEFESVRPLPKSAETLVKLLVYYLPQFHSIPENDNWWGAGFTEWTNVARGIPRFVGHYQPRIPRDLGHYDLSNTEVIRRQIRLALGAGIFGFIFYFYWFNGHRLLERPLEAFLADDTLDFPFCLMWANENWTRRWDGASHDVLISQDYSSVDEIRLISCFARHFKDRRYVRLSGRPLLFIYRPGLIPDSRATLNRWRTLFKMHHQEDPILVMSQSFNDFDPHEFGMDGAIEFPPHKITDGLCKKTEALTILDDEFSGQVYDYDDIVNASLSTPTPNFPLIKTVTPSWDNDARRQGSGLVLHGSTPAKYEAWLGAIIRRARGRPFYGEAIVCINAWNEWAEGAYLEPDQHFGAAYLNATGRAVTGRTDCGPISMLLVGHDAFSAGAQHLLLCIGRQLRRRHGVSVSFLLLGGGSLVSAFEAEAPTTVVTSDSELRTAMATFRGRGFRTALVNSAAAAPVVEALILAEISVTLLVHELPGLLEERGLLNELCHAIELAQCTVFPAKTVKERVLGRLCLPSGQSKVLPQGVYKICEFSPSGRLERRSSLSLPPAAKLVVGIGYADLRKGFDLFLQTWRAAQRLEPTAHFVWLGEADPALARHLNAEIRSARATGTFHMPGWSDQVAEWLSAADVFVSTSREDPLPSVVLEALSCGLPVVAFEGSGGIPDLLVENDGGAVSELGNVADMAARALQLAGLQGEALTKRRKRLASMVDKSFRFDRYVSSLLQVAHPGLLKITVIVTNYNYAHYLRQRLVSIFSQTYPVFEILVLDDASTDDSVTVAEVAAADWVRDIKILSNARNSGSPFAQWHRAATLARGEFVWIAEADDLSDPNFLEVLAQAVAREPDAAIAFTDSRSIDADGATTSTSYKDYYRQSHVESLFVDRTFSARDFLYKCMSEKNSILNVSAVLWRRSELVQACSNCRADLVSFQLAGDWRVYVELLMGTTGKVVYSADTINVHRRHNKSASFRYAASHLVKEVRSIHQIVARHFSNNSDLLAKQASYVAQLMLSAYTVVDCA